VGRLLLLQLDERLHENPSTSPQCSNAVEESWATISRGIKSCFFLSCYSQAVTRSVSEDYRQGINASMRPTCQLIAENIVLTGIPWRNVYTLSVNVGNKRRPHSMSSMMFRLNARSLFDLIFLIRYSKFVVCAI
jgi:hypothetical protein